MTRLLKASLARALLAECVPTFAQGAFRSRLSALVEEDRAEAVRVLRALAGSF